MRKSVRQRVFAAKRAKTAKGTRFLRSLVQRRGLCGERGQSGREVNATEKLHVGVSAHTETVIVKLHAFAWNGQAVTTHEDPHSACEDVSSSLGPAFRATMPNAQAGHMGRISPGQDMSGRQHGWSESRESTELLQYIAMQSKCPLMLRPSMGREGGMLGRIVRRIFRRWYANSAFMLVAVGFRGTRVLISCLGIWKVILRYPRSCVDRVFSAHSTVPTTIEIPDIEDIHRIYLTFASISSACVAATSPQ